MTEPDRPQMTKCRMGIICCIIKITDAHAEYVILLAIHGNNSYTKTSLYYVIRTLSSWFIWYLHLIIIIFIIIIEGLGRDRPVSTLCNWLFKGLVSLLRWFGLYYQTLFHVWYYELLWQVWDLNCSDYWYTVLKFCVPTLLRKFIPVVFAVQSAVQCIRFKHNNLFIDLYLSCKIMYMFRLKSCHHQDD